MKLLRGNPDLRFFRRFAGSSSLIVASIAFHGVAFAAAAYAHGSSAKSGAGEIVQTLEIEAPEIVPATEEAPEPPPAKPEIAENTAAPIAPTHVHDYPVPSAHDATPHDPSVVHSPIGLADHDPPTAKNDATDPNEAPNVAATAAPEAPHFTIDLSKSLTASRGGIVRAGGDGDGSGAHGASSAPASGTAENPIAEGQVDAPATIAFKPEVAYPREAAAEGVEADVPVEIVVDESGVVRSSRALSHAGFGLESAAVSGVRGYRFRPAQRGGRAVAVRMKWVVEFKLR